MDRLEDILLAIERKDSIPHEPTDWPIIKLISFRTFTRADINRVRWLQHRLLEIFGVRFVAVGGGYGCTKIVFDVQGISRAEVMSVVFEMMASKEFRNVGVEVEFRIAICEQPYMRSDLRTGQIEISEAAKQQQALYIMANELTLMSNNTNITNIDGGVTNSNLAIGSESNTLQVNHRPGNKALTDLLGSMRLAIDSDQGLSAEQKQALPEKIVVLFLASNPADSQQLRLDEEARSIAELIRKAKHRDSVVFESRWAVRPMDVLQAINEVNPTVVHFSGHGSDSDEIVFQDNNGNTKLVGKEAIVQTMMASSSQIRLVFFNTCYSHNQAESVIRHVEAAIGMKTSIGDEAARVFSSQFYSSVGFGLSIQKAFEQAKALLMMEGLGEEDTPELFVRDGLSSTDLILVRPQDLRSST